MTTTIRLILASLLLLLGTACGDGTIGEGGLAPDGDEDSDGTLNQDDCDPLDPALNELDVDDDGASTCGGDCDDQDPGLNLLDLDGDASTTCDGDCDDTDALLNLLDGDGDGNSTCAGDCDDTDPALNRNCLLYTSPSPRDLSTSRMPSSA